MKYWLAILLVLLSISAHASMDDDPLLGAIDLEHMEYREAGEQVLEGEMWIGRDYSRWVGAFDIDRHEGKTESQQYDLIHRRPLTAFWDVDLGGRYLKAEGPDSSWILIGVKGLAPFFIETKAQLLLKDSQAWLDLDLSYEMPVTSNWVLEVGLEADLYGKDDPGRDQFSGITSAEFHLVLKYERHKNIHPYVGWTSTHRFGDAADAGPSAGNAGVVGLSVWF